MRYPRWFHLLLATLLVALSTAAHAQATYRLTPILDPVFNPNIGDINENGEMVGTVGTEPPRAILLRDGMVIELGDLMGGASPFTSAVAINDLRQITGLSDVIDASGVPGFRGFLWESGQIRDLGLDPANAPRDINNRGQIVGASARGPFLWEEGRTTFLELLPCPTRPEGDARAINENGVIVGWSRAASSGERAVMWQNGEIMVLEPPIPLAAGEARDVNDRGEAIGIYLDRSNISQITKGFLWHAAGVTPLPPLAGAFQAEPTSINNARQIVGFTTGPERAMLWQDGAVLDLNELISDDDPANGFVTLTRAIRINDAGLIIAIGEDSRGSDPTDPESRIRNFYLLTPTGTPALSAATPPPSASSPPPSDSGGGAVELLSLLLLVIVMLSGAALARRRHVATAARPRPFG